MKRSTFYGLGAALLASTSIASFLDPTGFSVREPVPRYRGKIPAKAGRARIDRSKIKAARKQRHRSL